MLVYDLEGRGEKPLYEYLYFCIREDILSGRLKAGEKLPSKREMAGSHKIAVITVENAYAQLQIEGYLTAKERSGYYVNAGMENYPRRTDRGKLPKKEGERIGRSDRRGAPEEAEEGEPFGEESRANGKTGKSRETKRRPETAGKRELLADFTSNHAAGNAFPFSTWAKLMRRVLSDRERSFSEKPPAEGIPELREAIAEYLKKAKGLEASPERIIVGPGTEYLHHLLLLMVGHNRLVAVEDPGYKKVGQLYEGNGMKCLYIPVDHGGMIVDRLEGSNATLVHISPSHHFPTGCVMPAGRRHRLLQWAEAQNAYIVEDDYDSEFRFDGRPVPTLASLDDGHVIYMNTFTKTLAPSIRIAYMVLPEALWNLFRSRLQFLSGAVSSFEQYTLAAFIKEGYYERHISRMRNAFRQHRARMLTAFRESALSEAAEVEEDSAGLHFILHVKREIDDEEFVRRLEERGARLDPVSQFCYRSGQQYRHRFIIHYSDFSEDVLEKAFELMKREIESL